MFVTKFLFSCAILFTSVPVAAQAMSININGKPGGLSGRLAESVVQALNESGTSASVKYLGNCKVGERIYSTHTDQVFIMNLGTTVYGSCKFDIKQHNLVDILYSQTWAVCHQKDRPELNRQHFLDKKQSKIVMTVHIVKPMIVTWMADLGLDNTKVLAVGRSSDVLAASFAREGDYFVMDSTSAIEQQDRLACLFNTGNQKLPGLDAPPLNEFSGGKVRYPALYSTQILVVSGNTPQTNLWRQAMKKVRASEIWTKASNQPGIETIKVEDQWKFFENQRKVFLETQDIADQKP